MFQWFAPLDLVVTCEGELSLEVIVIRDREGRVTELVLPPKLLIMANHQVYPSAISPDCVNSYPSHPRLMPTRGSSGS